jgi:glutamate 5-kinase
MAYRRVVIKVGTSTLTDETGALDRIYIASLAMQCAAEHRSGADVVLVSSGAIRAGIDQWENYAGQTVPIKCVLPCPSSRRWRLSVSPS